VPASVRKRKLAELFGLTARAFRASPPSVEGLSWRRRLRRYACFTATMAEETARAGADVEATQKRLFGEAAYLGQALAKELRVASFAQVMSAARILYRNLRIDLKCDGRGEIVVRKCFFARFYSPAACRLMSSLDAGIFAGLAGGGTLVFDRRLTEGHDCCRAHFGLLGAPCEQP